MKIPMTFRIDAALAEKLEKVHKTWPFPPKVRIVESGIRNELKKLEGKKHSNANGKN